MIGKQKTKEKESELFIHIVKTVLKSIPKYQCDKTEFDQRLKEVIAFRDRLIIEMSGQAVHAFINRISPETLSNSIYKTACDLAYASILEELPRNDKISGIKENFDAEDNSGQKE